MGAKGITDLLRSTLCENHIEYDAIFRRYFAGISFWYLFNCGWLI